MAIIRRWIRTFVIASVVTGPVFIVVAIGLALYTAVFISYASRTTGTVTRLTAQTDSDGTVTYRPTFELKTPSGKTIIRDSNKSSNPAGFSVGEHVTALFSITNPSDAEIEDQLWMFPTLFGLIGIVCTVFGCFLFGIGRISTVPLLSWTKANSVSVSTTIR
jgi:hypothetical protein